jgi:hypothetical protein
MATLTAASHHPALPVSSTKPFFQSDMDWSACGQMAMAGTIGLLVDAGGPYVNRRRDLRKFVNRGLARCKISLRGHHCNKAASVKTLVLRRPKFERPNRTADTHGLIYLVGLVVVVLAVLSFFGLR